MGRGGIEILDSGFSQVVMDQQGIHMQQHSHWASSSNSQSEEEEEEEEDYEQSSYSHGI